MPPGVTLTINKPSAAGEVPAHVEGGEGDGILLEEAAPTAQHAHVLVPEAPLPHLDHCADHRIESGTVSATGEDAHAHLPTVAACTRLRQAQRARNCAHSAVACLPMEFIDIPDARIAFGVRGHAPPVGLIHGWACRRTDFEAIVVDLARDHRVHALDLPWHGQSTSARLDWDVGDLGALVAEVAAA